MSRKETKFKQTEVGMIPEDWEVKTINEFTILQAGGTPSTLREEFWNGDIRWMNSGELNNKRIHDVAGRITELGLKNSSTHMIPSKCVLIGLAGQGKTRGTAAINYVSLCTNQSIAAIFPSKIHNSEYLYQNINSRYDELRDLSSGDGGRGGLNLKILGNLLVPIPSLAEQTAIATALSDMDHLIESLGKLIVKKKRVKQGAMQQLLTGKKRLPGFGPKASPRSARNAKCAASEPGFKQTELGTIPEDWEVKNISKTCSIKARIGWQGLKSTEYLRSGNYILVTGTDFKNGFIDWSTCNYVSEWRFKQDKNIQIKKGDVLVTKDGTIGKVAFLNEIPMNGTLNSGVFVVRSKDNNAIDSVYLSLVFKSLWFDNFLDEITSGSTIVHLYQKDFVKFNFPVPSSIEEQTAIAQVLGDMDLEIQSLEAKLAKYRKLKTGMMQQLLTGKIRLV